MMRFLVLFLLFLFSFKEKENYTETGKASFYANKFEGRRTSSGEVFKQKLLTGAHKKLPFGTMVKITNLSNNKEVTVKINDRLSQKSASCVDVTLTAAKELDFVSKGHTQVKLEVLE